MMPSSTAGNCEVRGAEDNAGHASALPHDSNCWLIDCGLQQPNKV